MPQPECGRIADQLRRAFTGEAWHGPSLLELLPDVTAEQANMRPLPAGHTIWELVLHIDVYLRGTLDAAQGGKMPKIYGTENDWTSVSDASGPAWAGATDRMFQNAELLVRAIEGFGDVKLENIVPGRDYSFYFLFHGVLQHSLYHGGQIAMLKREMAAGL